MSLPFSHEQFLDLFGQYNRDLWPFLAGLWLATAWWAWRLYRNGSGASRAMALVLALHWMWSGVIYQLIYFRTINPAAVWFGTLFLLQAGLLVWQGVLKADLEFAQRTRWSLAGWGLVVYSMVYPAIGLLTGLRAPRWPSFGVPCPTTILTAGLLLLLPRRRARVLAVIPVLWAGVGASAAFLLGIRADTVLAVAGLFLLIYVVMPDRIPEWERKIPA